MSLADGSLLRPRRRRAFGVNVVPLVDVLTVLIFFFLVVMQFRGEKTLDVTPPKIETAGEAVFEQQIEVAVTEDGKFFLNGAPLEQAQLEAALLALAQGSTRAPVIILADEESALKHLVWLYDLLRRHNFQSYRLQSR